MVATVVVAMVAMPTCDKMEAKECVMEKRMGSLHHVRFTALTATTTSALLGCVADSLG